MKNLKEAILNKKSLAVIICLMCMTFSVLLSACSFGSLDMTKAESKENSDNITKSNIDNILTNQNTKVTLKRYYTKAEMSNSETVKIDSDKIGLSKNEFMEKYKGWQADSFTADNIVLSKDIDSYPKGYYKISVLIDTAEEYVAVYEFDKDGNANLMEATHTPVELFDSKTVKELRDGIIVDNKDRLYTLLQNYAE